MDQLKLYDQLGGQDHALYRKPAGLVTAEDVAARLGAHIKGKTVLVTGCGLASLGKHIAWTIASYSPRQLIICGRSDVRLRLLASNLRNRNPDLDIQHEVFDLADLAQVRAAAERINAPERPAVDVIICSAAIMMQPLRKTVDGLESHFGINTVAHFVLVNMLLPRMIANGGGRIVTTTSGAYVYQGIRWDDPNYEVGFQNAYKQRSYSSTSLQSVGSGQMKVVEERTNGADRSPRSTMVPWRTHQARLPTSSSPLLLLIGTATKASSVPVWTLEVVLPRQIWPAI
jgi:hypothetical protein